MLWRLLTIGNILSGSLVLVSSYFLLRLKKVSLPIHPSDEFMIALLAVLALLGAVYILFQNLRRDTVRTLL